MPNPIVVYEQGSWDGGPDGGWVLRGVTYGDEHHDSSGTDFANVDPTEGLHRLIAGIAGITGTDDFAIEVEFTKSNTTSTMHGPWIIDDAGNGMMAAHFGAGLVMSEVHSWSYVGGISSVAASGNLATARIRLIKRGNTYYTQRSEDGGEHWTPESSGYTPLTPEGDPRFPTPTRVGFGATYGASNWADIKYFRVYKDPPPFTASYRDEVLADSPLAYWRLAESSGTTMVDSSGNGHNGTYVNSPALGAASLIADNDTAVDFDGISDYANVPYGAWADLTSEVTVEAWIRPDPRVDGVENMIFERSEGGVVSVGLSVTTTGQVRFRVRKNTAGSTGVTSYLTNPSVVEAGTGPGFDFIYHIAATFGSSGAKIYVNGFLAYSSATTGTLVPTAAPSIRIGASGQDDQHFDGRIDEVAYYGTALSGARIKAHYDAVLRQTLGFRGTGTLSRAAVPGISGAAGLSGDGTLAGAESTPQDWAGSGDLSGDGGLSLTEGIVMLVITEVVFGGDGSSVIELDEGFQGDLLVQLAYTEIDSAPSALAVSVYDAMSQDDIVFSINGTEVLRELADPDGSLEVVSVPVPDFKEDGEHIMQPGTYTLTVTQGASIGTADFSIVNPPAPEPEETQEDAPPAYVPASIQPNGTRRWVFQDLMPGGIGSWVLPMNPDPEKSEAPPMARELTAKTTTLSDEQGGQFHVWENEWQPQEWKFGGYCPTEEMREQFEAYYDLERRWYLHDHRGRAWKVTFQSLSMVPRRTQIWNGEWSHQGHDYEAVVLVTNHGWTDV